MATCESQPSELVRHASFPGGCARQFRVQMFHHDEQCWRLVANFLERPEAERCRESLEIDGHLARIIDARCVPAAS